MPRYRVLVSWIGGHDLDAFARRLEHARRRRLFTKPYYSWEGEESGPLRTLIEARTFDAVRLISNYDRAQSEAYTQWLGVDASLSWVELRNPTDYRVVFEVSDGFLAEATRGVSPHDLELAIHLSSGTPTMAAVWVLLGKSRYPATFYQTYRNSAWETEIPFDLDVDYIPERLRDRDRALQHLASSRPDELHGFESIVGDCKGLREAVGRAARAAIRNVPVLLLGESGTGKEMFARAIHRASARRDGPFVALNCAAIPGTLLESELFGHSKGAFTGATEDRAGAFEEADGGTLFLDEIGECGPDLQAKLLRVLQPPVGAGPSSRVFRRIGESRDRSSDVRLLAATNRNLLEAARDASFREDLYYRLAVITIRIPPLRERIGDIAALTEAFLAEVNRHFQAEEPRYRPRKLSRACLSYLRGRSWPGNVRELYNALVQAVVLSEGETLTPRDFAAASSEAPSSSRSVEADLPLGKGFSLEKHLEAIQKRYLERAMDEAQGVKTRAAALLGYRSYQTLDAQLKRLRVPTRRRYSR